jgi:poly-gamma-glutamate system protein
MRGRTAPYNKARLPLWALGIVFAGALAGFLVLETARFLHPDPLRTEKTVAVDLMRAALQAVKSEKLRIGIKIDPLDDSGDTGIIGERYNDLTTTVGSLPSKRTTANPLFAAAVVEMLGRAGASAGDAVAVSFSGSFPALNIAVLAAAKALRLQPVVISSVGASMYGANNPDMSWLDMERVLQEKGVLPYRSVAASLGGISDTKGGLDGSGIETGLAIISRNRVRFLDEGGVPAQGADIGRRLSLYKDLLEGRKLAAFINVGASQTSLGNSPQAYGLAPGLLKHLPASDDPERGIIFRMAEAGVPVIHLLGIRKLARQFGIPFDPSPVPSWFRPASHATPAAYSSLLAGLALISLLGLMALLGRIAAPRAA